MKECISCFYVDICALLEQQKNLKDNWCKDFLDTDDADCSADEGDTWKEFSWNRYTENILDYGEESDWDKFLNETYM